MSRKFVHASTQSANVAAAIVSAYPYSFGCWFKPTVVNRTNALMTKITGSFGNYTILYVANDGKLHVSLFDGTSGPEMTGAAVSANVWHHGLFVANSSTDRRLYLDGTNKVTQATSQTYGNADHWHVGGDSADADSADASIAECATWNVALTDNEAMAIFQGDRPFRVRPSALVAYWPLFGLNSPETDYSGNMRSLTLVNSPTQDGHVNMRRFTKVVPYTEVPAVVAQRPPPLLIVRQEEWLEDY